MVFLDSPCGAVKKGVYIPFKYSSRKSRAVFPMFHPKTTGTVPHNESELVYFGVTTTLKQE